MLPLLARSRFIMPTTPTITSAMARHAHTVVNSGLCNDFSDKPTHPATGVMFPAALAEVTTVTPFFGRAKWNPSYFFVFQDSPTKTLEQRAIEKEIEERIQSLFDKNCSESLRLYITGSLFRLAREEEQPQRQIASELLIRLSEDTELPIPSENRAHVLQTLGEYKFEIKNKLGEAIQPLFAKKCDAFKCEIILNDIGDLVRSGNAIEKQVAAELLIWLRHEACVAISPNAKDQALNKVDKLNREFAFLGLDTSELKESDLGDLYVVKIDDYIFTLRDAHMFRTTDRYESGWVYQAPFTETIQSTQRDFTDEQKREVALQRLLAE